MTPFNINSWEVFLKYMKNKKKVTHIAKMSVGKFIIYEPNTTYLSIFI